MAIALLIAFSVYVCVLSEGEEEGNTRDMHVGAQVGWLKAAA
jgi:hypothetical protein